MNEVNIEIFFDDLEKSVQEDIVKQLGFSSINDFVKNNNFDVFPLANIILGKKEER